MKKIFLLLLIFTFMFCKKTINVSMVTSTSMENGLPFLALQGKEWHAEHSAEFVKLHIYADDAFPLSKVEIVPCTGEFNDQVNVYINFDESVRIAEKKKKSAEVVFEKGVTARSVTLNFMKNTEICVSGIYLYDDKGRKYNTNLPDVVEGTVTATETASPEESYNVMNLFDSKYENAYASNKMSAGVALQFNFKNDVDITKIKVWNGYQRSDVHCIDNGRIKEWAITGDNGYNEKITLEDSLGSQDIQLPKPFKGKNLTFTVSSAYPGRSYKGIIMSELRFGNDKKWFLLDPFPRTKDIAAHHLESFTKAELIDILNKGLVGYDEVLPADDSVVEPAANNYSASINMSNNNGQVEEKQAPVEGENPPQIDQTRTNSNWKIRLRSDGSLFIQGNTSKLSGIEATENTFFGMGNYEIKAAAPNKMTVRLFGFLRSMKSTNFLEYGGEGDCNGCGRDCNKVADADPNNVEKIFQEYVDIYKRNGRFFIVNQKRTTNLDFESLGMSFE